MEERRSRTTVQYQNISSWDDGSATDASVYQVLTLTRVGDSVDWVLMLIFAIVSMSVLWRWLGVFTTATQLSSTSFAPSSPPSSALQMSSRLMVLELLLSTAFDLFIDLQRFAAVDSWMRFVWLALCPTLFFVLLPKTVSGWWCGWWYCCCVGPFRFDVCPSDGDRFLWLWLSVDFECVDPLPLPLCFAVDWTFNFTIWVESGARCGAFCDDNDEVKLRRLPSSSLPLGHMVESNTSIEFVMAWSQRQQSRNSSIVTTPSWFRSIFWRFSIWCATNLWNENKRTINYLLGGQRQLHKVSEADENKAT